MCTTFIFQTITPNKHQPIESRKLLKQAKQSFRLNFTINLRALDDYDILTSSYNVMKYTKLKKN